MYDIESLYEATSVADACRALAEDERAEVIAGGTDVLVKLREGKGAPAHLVSIHGLGDELDGVRLLDDGTVWVGPITWFHHVTISPIIQDTVPVLGDACDTPGGPQLRVSGTIGGNVCSAATSADSASTLYAYGAHRGVVRGPGSQPQGARRGAHRHPHPARELRGLHRPLLQVRQAPRARDYHDGLLLPRQAWRGQAHDRRHPPRLRRRGPHAHTRPRTRSAARTWPRLPSASASSPARAPTRAIPGARARTSASSSLRRCLSAP